MLSATCPVAAVADVPTGLRVSRASATTLGVAAGVAQADAGTLQTMTLKAAVVVNLAVNGALGLDTGAVAADSMYYIYLLQGTSGQTVVASLSNTWAGVTKPAAYAVSGRRIGSWSTINGAATLSEAIQEGTGGERTLRYLSKAGNANLRVLNGGTATVSADINISKVVPTTATSVQVNELLVAGLATTPQAQMGYGGNFQALLAGPDLLTTSMCATLACKPGTPATGLSYQVSGSVAPALTVDVMSYTETI